MEGSTTEAQGQGAPQGMGASNGESGCEGSMALQVAAEGSSSVRMIADSMSDRGIRLSTMHLRYWRPIHSELMTHRVFSRNARSSRAVPVATLMKEDIFIPQFGLNQPGMQSTESLTDAQQEEARRIWVDLAEHTRSRVKRLQELGVHKQWANRPLEWFGWIDVLVSSTCWANFWALRIDDAAQPELRTLAEQMHEVMDRSRPELLLPDEWHLPYVSHEERHSPHPMPLGALLKISTARCARLSYKPFDGNADYDAEVARYDRLVVSQPVHASPAEHQATPDVQAGQDFKAWIRPDLHGNFVGWRQHRKMIPSEAVLDAF